MITPIQAIVGAVNIGVKLIVPLLLFYVLSATGVLKRFTDWFNKQFAYMKD